MSADYRTEHFTGYYHDDYVAVFLNDDGELLGAFTPALVAELQSVTDQWKAAKNGQTSAREAVDAAFARTAVSPDDLRLPLPRQRWQMPCPRCHDIVPVSAAAEPDEALEAEFACPACGFRSHVTVQPEARWSSGG